MPCVAASDAGRRFDVLRCCLAGAAVRCRPLNPVAGMQIQVNGDSREVPAGATVADLLAVLGLAEKRLAVEHNGQIIRRADFAQVRLQAEDRVEIVHAIGGGQA